MSVPNYEENDVLEGGIVEDTNNAVPTVEDSTDIAVGTAAGES